VKAKSGTQFDPRVVEALVGMWDSGKLSKMAMRRDEEAERSNRGERATAAPECLVLVD
jgi:hypothetical protein